MVFGRYLVFGYLGPLGPLSGWRRIFLWAFSLLYTDGADDAPLEGKGDLSPS